MMKPIGHWGIALEKFYNDFFYVQYYLMTNANDWYFQIFSFSLAEYSSSGSW